MKYLRVLELNKTVSDIQIIVDDEIFSLVHIYEWYISHLSVDGIFRKLRIFNKGEYTWKRIYLSEMITDYYYQEYTGFPAKPCIGFKNGNTNDYRKDNFLIFDSQKHRTTIWNPADHHINPHILN